MLPQNCETDAIKESIGVFGWKGSGVKGRGCGCGWFNESYLDVFKRGKREGFEGIWRGILKRFKLSIYIYFFKINKWES